VTPLTDSDLAHLAADLVAHLQVSAEWPLHSRLYGLSRTDLVSVRSVAASPGRWWLELADGDPYDFLDRVWLDADELPAVALAATGWAAPLDHCRTTRPSQHPRRERIRTVVVVSADGRQCSALQRQTGEVVLDQSEGPLLRALLRLWSEPGRAA
jgi:hypothetical protein